MKEELRALEAVLGHTFVEPQLLHRALTHKSRAFEASDGDPGIDAHNEQLEFLGDAVLGFLVSEALVQRFPELPEGRLSKFKARLVSASHLSEVAARLDLGTHLLLGKGEEMSGGRGKKALLANALEAVIAAVYLDAGIAAARTFIVTRLIGDSPTAGLGTLPDFKSALQEATQSRKLPLPRYRIVDSAGPDHATVFTVEAQVGDEWREQGQGSSKKTAAQRAARLMLERLEAGDEQES